jgi:DNA-binding NtrC family response regulator
MMAGSNQQTILIVDDDLAFRLGTLALLEDQGLSAATAVSTEDAKKKLAQCQYDLVLSDLVMPDASGIDLLKHIRQVDPDLPVIMVTGYASVGTAVEAMRMGARDYVTKPCDNDELLLKIRRALEEKARDRELRNLRDTVREVFSFGKMLGQNSKIRDVFRLVEQVASTEVPVLILGETGTGKELVAKAIHFNSTRRNNKFIVINCSALSESIMESELFGHEKGAFTGADRQRRGKFEEAQSGTVFLDEVGDVPLHIQTKLLRVLQEKEIQRVGGTETITVDIRVVAATNRSLSEMIAAGRFREDLFYRLNVFPITLPPLRERLDDLPMLTEHFLKKHLSLAHGQVTGISPTLFASMMSYRWPGNIRELENLIKRAIIKTTGDTLEAIELPSQEFAPVVRHPDAPTIGMSTPFKEYLSTINRHAEETYLLHMLEIHKGNVNQIAKLMDVDRKTVYRMLAEYSVDPAKYRSSER